MEVQFNFLHTRFVNRTSHGREWNRWKPIEDFMLLSSQLFDRIVGMSDSTARQATVLPVGCRRAADKRQVARIAFGQRSQICLDRGKNAGVWETVMVQDISPKGIGFLCHEAVDHGNTFMLKLTDSQGETIRIRCRVQRCERGGFGNTAFLVGATFEQVIQKQVLRVNDDEETKTHWQHSAPVDAEAAVEASALKTAGGAVARAAASFFRAVDPLRVAALWTRKADDFS
jgi:hypothetical protein